MVPVHRLVLSIPTYLYYFYLVIPMCIDFVYHLMCIFKVVLSVQGGDNDFAGFAVPKW